MKPDSSPTLESLFAGGVVIGDGAMGTEIQQYTGMHLPLPEALTLDAKGQDAIRRIHERYVEAGAQILETNTFAANPIKLKSIGLEEQCEPIIAMAVKLARTAAQGRALVAGSIGPLDLGLAGKDMDDAVLASAFRRPIAALVKAGVDILFLETFSSVHETRLALAEAAQTGVPVFFSIGGASLSRPHARKTVSDLVDQANQAGVRAVGINCMAPYDLSKVLPLVADRTSLPLMAYPNAGTPAIERGVVRYDLPTAVLQAEALNWYKQGAVILGGCCGTTPAHIRGLSEQFHGKPVQPRAKPSAPGVSVKTAPRPEKERPVVLAVNPIREKLRSVKRPLIAVEIKASLERPLADTVSAVESIALAGVDFFDIPDNPGASPNRDCTACAFLLQQKYGIPVIIHKTATQTNALHMHSYLLGAYDLGIRGVLAVTGDPPHVGPFDRIASRVSDIRNAADLLHLIALLRTGELMNGQPLPAPVDFAAGCAYAPTLSLQNQTQWLARKVEAGAEFVFTQPVFTHDDYSRMRDATRELSVPIFPGIFPLVSARQAAFLQSGKIPGVVVPEAEVKAIARFQDPADQAKAGLDATLRLINNLAATTVGFYLIMPFHKNSIRWTTDLVKHMAGYRVKP